jgi:hypothetical protein
MDPREVLFLSCWRTARRIRRQLFLCRPRSHIWSPRNRDKELSACHVGISAILLNAASYACHLAECGPQAMTSGSLLAMLLFCHTRDICFTACHVRRQVTPRSRDM